MADQIKYYRASSKAANRTADGTETLPKTADRTAILRMADAVNTALQLKLPGAQAAADNLLTHILAEGRDDAGVNTYDTNNKIGNAVFNTLRGTGADYMFQVSPQQTTEDPAMYVAASAVNEATAKRLGKPFAEIWNGTGKSAATGRTGAQHADRFQAAKSVASSAKNADIKALIDRVTKQGATQAEQFEMRRPEIVSAIAQSRNPKDAGMGYSVQFNSGTLPKTDAVRQVLNKVSSNTLSANMPELVTNLLGSTIGVPGKQLAMPANMQTELEIALSSPVGRKLLEESRILPAPQSGGLVK